MKKIAKTICCSVLSLATIFAIAGCSKKNNKPTDTKPTDTNTSEVTPDVKKEASINFGANVDGVEYAIYTVKNGKKEVVDTTKKVATNTELLVEVTNRSDKNVDIASSLGTNKAVQSKTKDSMNITLTGDLTITSTESNKMFVNLSDDGHISFIAYYMDSNNQKQEFTDTFTVEKNTKVFFQGVNDTTSSVTGFMFMNGENVDRSDMLYKTGHDPKVTDFNAEGTVITGNISTGYYPGVKATVTASVDAENVTVTCKDLYTTEDINIVGEYPTVSILDKIKVTVNNPTGKKLVFSCNDDLKVFDDTTFEYTTYVTKYTFISIDDYAEYNLTLNIDDAVDAYFYSYDNDGIEYELTNGKYIVDTQISGIIKNNTKYELSIEFRDGEGYYTYGFKMNGYETVNLVEKAYSTIPITGDTVINVIVTDVETEFCKVTFENKTTYNGVIRLGYYRGMYDYPEAEFDTDIVKGTYMAWVGDNNTGVEFMVYVYNADTNELKSSEDVGGYESCATGFPLTSNIKIVLDYNNLD